MPGQTFFFLAEGQVKVRRIVDEAEALTFVPGFLAIHGLTLIAPFKGMFSYPRRISFLAKAKEYNDRGPAIEYLCDWLKHSLDGRWTNPSSK